MIIQYKLPEDLEQFAHLCKRVLTNGTKQAHCVYWDIKLEKIAVLSVISEFRGELMHDGTRRYTPIAKFDYLIEPKKQRCCGRCDGVNDTCITDMECQKHNNTGCEICYGHRIEPEYGC